MDFNYEKVLRHKLNNLLFIWNLQELAQQTEDVNKLLVNQQISNLEAEQQINNLWQEFENLVKQLGGEFFDDECLRGNRKLPG